MQAIQTKWLGPTNTQGSRVKAFSVAFPRGVTVGWDYALGVEGNHDAAARAFIVSKCWQGIWARGCSPDGKGNVYVYVCVGRSYGPTAKLKRLAAALGSEAIYVPIGGAE